MATADAGVPSLLARLEAPVAGAIAGGRIGIARSVRLTVAAGASPDLPHELEAAFGMIDRWFGCDRVSTRSMSGRQFRSGLALWKGGQVAVVSVFAGPGRHVDLLLLGSAGSIAYERIG